MEEIPGLTCLIGCPPQRKEGSVRIATNQWLLSNSSQVNAPSATAPQSLVATKLARLPCPLSPAAASTLSSLCCSVVPTIGLAATMLPMPRASVASEERSALSGIDEA